MGYLTTITIYNDALNDFKNDPRAFAIAIFEGIDEANDMCKSAHVLFKDRSGYLTVHPSRHGSDNTVYVLKGNCVTEINPYSKDIKRLVEEKPDFIRSIVKIVKSDIKGLEKLLAEAKNQSKARKK